MITKFILLPLKSPLNPVLPHPLCFLLLGHSYFPPTSQYPLNQPLSLQALLPSMQYEKGYSPEATWKMHIWSNMNTCLSPSILLPDQNCAFSFSNNSCFLSLETPHTVVCWPLSFPTISSENTSQVQSAYHVFQEDISVEIQCIYSIGFHAKYSFLKEHTTLNRNCLFTCLLYLDLGLW